MLVHGAFHAGLAQMVIAQVHQFAQSLVPLAGNRQISNLQQAISGLSHCGNHHHRLAIQPGADDSNDALDRFAGLDRGPPEFHDYHQSSSPSEYMSSALSTAAPAAPRMVLCPSAMNL